MKNQSYQPTGFSDGYDKVGSAEAIVQYMHELQNEGVHSSARDTVTYNTVIGVYASFSNKVNKYSSLEAEKLLRDMIYFRNNRNPLIAPDHRYYNHLVSDWVITKQTNSAGQSDW